MARIFDPNLPKAGPNLDWAGRYFFAEKELAILAGFTVRGSGGGSGRFAWNGVTAALPVLEQGSGGTYDCWLTGASRSNSSPAVAGDAGNANAWLVLEDPAGRQTLLAMTNQTTSNWDGYGRIAAARAGSGGFDGTVAAAATIPGAPAGGAGDEVFLFGTRAVASGDPIFLYATSGYVHCYADTTPGVDGGLSLGFWTVTSALAPQHAMALAPVVSAASPADIDPYAYFAFGSSGVLVATSCAWSWAGGPTYTRRALNSQSINGFWPVLGQSDPITGTDSLSLPLAVTTTDEVWKGDLHPTCFYLQPAARGWGNYGPDAADLSMYYASAGTYAWPWPDAGTVPLP